MYSNHSKSVYTVNSNTMKFANLVDIRFTQFDQVSFIQWTNSITTLVPFVSEYSLDLFYLGRRRRRKRKAYTITLHYSEGAPSTNEKRRLSATKTTEQTRFPFPVSRFLTYPWDPHHRTVCLQNVTPCQHDTSILSHSCSILARQRIVP